MSEVTSPLQGTVVRLLVAVGDDVRAGQELLVLESMKMEHPVEAEADGVVDALLVAEGATVMAGADLVPGGDEKADDGPLQWRRDLRHPRCLAAAIHVGLFSTTWTWILDPHVSGAAG